MNNKTIILVNVTEIVRDRRSDIVFPLGMLYLANSLKQAGYTSVKKFNIPTIEIDQFIEQIKNEDILFVAVCSILTGLKIKAASQVSEALKKAVKAPIVWGGLFPSTLPELCLKKDYVDMIGMGEGEELVVDIARIYENKLEREMVKGIAYKDSSGKIVVNEKRPPLENLDRFRPDLEDVEVNDYIQVMDGGRFLPYPIMTSRGCPYNCAFCYNNAYNNRRWRKYSAGYVIDFLKDLKEKANFDYIVLADDNAFVDKERLVLIMKELFALGVKISHFGLKLNNLQGTDLQDFVDNGVRSIYYGIESFQDRVLKLCNKEHTRAQILNAIELISRYPRLKVVAGVVMAMPGETIDDIRADIREAVDNIRFGGNLSIYTVILFPLPGTKFYDDLISEGVLKEAEDINYWVDMSPYESENILRKMRPEASKKDIRLMIMAKRYTESVINLSRYAENQGETGRLYRLKNRLKNLGRYFFFSLGKWRLKNEVFFWSGLDFVGLKFLFNVERVGSKIIQSRIMQKLMR